MTRNNSITTKLYGARQYSKGWMSLHATESVCANTQRPLANTLRWYGLGGKGGDAARQSHCWKVQVVSPPTTHHGQIPAVLRTTHEMLSSCAGRYGRNILRCCCYHVSHTAYRINLLRVWTRWSYLLHVSRRTHAFSPVASQRLRATQVQYSCRVQQGVRTLQITQSARHRLFRYRNSWHISFNSCCCYAVSLMMWLGAKAQHKAEWQKRIDEAMPFVMPRDEEGFYIEESRFGRTHGDSAERQTRRKLWKWCWRLELCLWTGCTPHESKGCNLGVSWTSFVWILSWLSTIMSRAVVEMLKHLYYASWQCF